MRDGFHCNLNPCRREPYRTETAGALGPVMNKGNILAIFSACDQVTESARAEALQ